MRIMLNIRASNTCSLFEYYYFFSVSGPRVLPTSIFPSGSFSPSPTTVWRMEYDQPVSASSI